MTWPGRTLNSCLAMLAACSIQAGVCQAESLYWLSAENVRFNNFFDVGFSHVSVPDCVRVDYDVRTVFALIKAAGLISVDFTFQPVLG